MIQRYAAGLGHNFLLLGDEDELLASVDADPFSWGWSLGVYDCHGELLARVMVAEAPPWRSGAPPYQLQFVL